MVDDELEDDQRVKIEHYETFINDFLRTKLK